ncbi:hypothetical protein Lal_00023945 [Lupinus albus]|nr:hypothetical protein Lal_00023945 [Lupinus albus]
MEQFYKRLCNRITLISKIKAYIQDWGPKSFLLIDTCFEDKDFKAFVEKNLLNLSRWSTYVLKEKLKQLKDILKSWNKDHFGVIDKRIDNASSDVHKFDMKSELVPLDEEAIRKRSECWVDMWQARLMKHNLLFKNPDPNSLRLGTPTQSVLPWSKTGRRIISRNNSPNKTRDDPHSKVFHLGNSPHIYDNILLTTTFDEE